MQSAESQAYSPLKKRIPSIQGPERTRNRGEIFTSAQRRPNELESSGAELYGAYCVQDAPDPSVLPRYRVSSIRGESEQAHLDRRRKHQTFGLGQFGQT